jgi:predicted nuclease of restriction endonuclease-like (RecB) superfamily
VTESTDTVKQPPAPLLALPWGHNIALIQKVKDPPTRLWYAQAALKHGWSRNVLTVQIESRLHERQGKAITNFSIALPAPQSDLARQTLKILTSLISSHSTPPRGSANIAGNKVRLIAAVHYNRNKIYIRDVLTHQEYEAGKWKE